MLAKQSLVFAVVFFLFSFAAFSTVYYVSPMGNNSNNGSIGLPFLTIQRAQDAVVAGDTVYIRGGNYVMAESQIATYSNVWAYVTYLTKSGSNGKRINYWAYPGEKPVFDYSSVKPAGYRVHAFQVNGSWIHIKGLEVIGVQVTITTHTQSECFENQGSNNIYEMLSMHDGKAIGFYLTKGGNNLILNCDAYRNWDDVSEDKKGGNTDGFGCHPNNDGVGYTNNIFRGCRAWFNSDDGYDCINAFEATTFENCWAFYNGYSTAFGSLGDGNGFKAGGYGVTDFSNIPNPIPRNNIRFCLAVRNKANGFYANHHLGGSNWYNNTAYFNASNFNMLNRSADYSADVAGYDHNMKNNLGFSGRSTEYSNIDFTTCNADTNSFNLPVTVTSADFVSIDQNLLTAARQADGSLPNNDFMKLTSTSDLIDKGLNIGYSFIGAAPDLGCFESSYNTLPVSLVSFTANVVNASVVLKWKVATQVNNKGWEIERSTANAQKWTKIGFVAGSANSTQLTDYSFTDEKLAAGNYQYRLKQIDADGTVSYSSVVAVKIWSTAFFEMKVYPMPVTASSVVKYTLTSSANVQLNVYNAAGTMVSALVNAKQSAGVYENELNTSRLATNGLYFVKLVVDDKTTGSFFVKGM